MQPTNTTCTRRRFIKSAAATGVAAGLYELLPDYARADGPAIKPIQNQKPIELAVYQKSLNIDGRMGSAITLNGSIPGPMVRLKEGQDATMHVTNRLTDEDTSLHWHGLILPYDMDGVPGVSYAGIKPGQTFTYRFPVKQNGTYWYHSHTGLQEQLGHYGPLIIDPVEPEPFAYDREYVVMLSDWTFENPYHILAKLKKQSDYYNFQQQTVGDFINDAKQKGLASTIKERMAWGKMRMGRTDLADITGYTYTYLINGMAPESNWTGLFTPGERIRLRVINAATMSYFDFRIPGLKMTVVQADGQYVKPVTVDEFRIAVAETYDVIIEPQKDRAYTLFAEAMDRSGYTRGTIAPRAGMAAPVPPLRKRPLLTMTDMGMGGMAGMNMSTDPKSLHPGHPGHPEQKAMPNMTMTGGKTGGTSGGGGGGMKHGPDHHGVGNAMVAMMPKSRLHEPGIGLENTGTRVLTYSDLKSLKTVDDHRPPDRELELHLTGNMERYMWSFDGKKYSEVNHLWFYLGERLRLTLVNDTMMAHPIHLHGMWMQLDNGSGPLNPRKHTISVKPGEILSADISVDAPGNWAFHCHLLYHMDMGMFRVVSVVSPAKEGGA